MKYFKYPDEYGPLDGGTTYIETENGYVVRQITVNGDRISASNICYLRWGLMLGEGKTDNAIEETLPKISVQEFDHIWHNHLSQHANHWASAKSANKLGRKVQGYIEIFYPQGVIVNLGNGVLGVADYDECRASTTRENMYTNHKATGLVIGYSELNQWLILGSPQVHEEKISVKEINYLRQEHELK